MNNNFFYRYRVKFGRKFSASTLSHLQHINYVRNIVISAGLEYVPLKFKNLDLPKISFGPALTVGYESISEYADFFLKEFLSDANLFDKILNVVKEGYSVVEVKRIPYHFPSVEALVNIAEYDIKTKFEVSAYDIEKFLSPSEILVRKIKPPEEEKTLNVRPLILSMKAVSSNNINLLLKFMPGQNVKPHLIIEKFAGKTDILLLRKGLYWKNKQGELMSP